MVTPSVLETVIESMKNVSRNDSKKMIHVQETIFQGLAGFMISELRVSAYQMVINQRNLERL